MLTNKFLNIPTIYTATVWTTDSVRGCCIECDYYTNGSNRDYSEMLDYVDENAPTPGNIYAVALDIVLHSEIENRYGCTTEEAIEAVMFELYAHAITTSVEIER